MLQNQLYVVKLETRRLKNASNIIGIDMEPALVNL